MGEVGTNSQDSPNINLKMNGVNGSCGEDEPMDDSQDDSQESSDVSTKKSDTNSEAASTKKSEASGVSATKNCDVGDNGASADVVHRDNEDEDGEEDLNSQDTDGEQSRDDEHDELDKDDERVKDKIKEPSNVENDVHEDEDREEDDKMDDEEDVDDEDVDEEENDTENEINEVDAHKPTLETVPEESQERDGDEEVSNHSSEQNISTRENGDDKDRQRAECKTDGDDTQDSDGASEDILNRPPVEEVDEDITQDSEAGSEEKNPLDGDEPMVVDSANGDSSMDDNDVEHVPIIQEVHNISDSDDDEYQQKRNNINPPKVVEQMEVDGVSKENGHKNDNVHIIDDDKPVSIHSDSDIEDEKDVSPSKNNGETSEVHEILSDKEDCVVIEDDNKKIDDKDLHSPRRSTRARKSVVKIRDFSAFDDDIEEVVEDPLSQPAAKKLKTSQIPSLGITIQDARSLIADPLLTSSAHTTFQQQFVQAQDSSAIGPGTPGRKKEPTLVIIDTNQIMARGGTAATVQALQNQNLSVHPVGSPAQGVYPTSMRASITPVMHKSPPTTITPTNKQHTSPQSNSITQQAALLPALTDDMFVLEAPSFIVPYIYEKPPADNLKDIVQQIGKDLADQRIKVEKEEADNEAKAFEAMTDEQKKLAEAEKKNAESKKKKSKKRAKNGDESWDEADTSSDEEASDSEQRTKVLIKEVNEDLDAIKTHIITPDSAKDSIAGGAAMSGKRDNYFESPLGKFFMDIGINLVQEHVQTDLLRQQKKKLNREGDNTSSSIQMAINSLKKNLEHSKVKNEVFKFETKRCEYCSFKSESALSMANHYETPHMNAHMYKCNFCSFEARPPYDILFHMEAVHNIKARLEKAVSYHQCPNCPFEDNGKSKLARHTLVCVKKFRPEVNLNPPADWEPPAKIPRIKPRHGLVGTATAYQAMAAQAQRAASNAALQRQNAVNAAMMRGRGRPQTVTKTSPAGTVLRANPAPISRPQMPGMILPNNFQMGASGQFIQTPGPKSSKTQQPSISITPLPRQPTNVALQATTSARTPNVGNMRPGQSPAGGGKGSFVICEICDGYIKDLDQLRNHMQWMHKVKIHPKMIYNRPPLNCQKCQFRFFTDQGLERHLLGSHGLVTSSMQEAANKGKDAGRCPVCGRMYQWKLLNHVSRDHNMTLKPAHLSYKCTVCTATFGMYKQFENHVYSAHSTVAKKAMDGKKQNTPTAGGSKSGNSSDSLLKPLKINDEITIIPQPAQRQSRGGGGGGGGGGNTSMDSHVIEIL